MFVWTIRDIIGFSFMSIVLLYVLIKWLFYFYDRAIIKFNKWMGKE